MGLLEVADADTTDGKGVGLAQVRLVGQAVVKPPKSAVGQARRGCGDSGDKSRVLRTALRGGRTVRIAFAA